MLRFAISGRTRMKGHFYYYHLQFLISEKQQCQRAFYMAFGLRPALNGPLV